MKKIEKAAIKTILDLARRYVFARAMNGGRAANEEEVAAMDTVSGILGASVDKQAAGSMMDVLEAMEKKNGTESREN